MRKFILSLLGIIVTILFTNVSVQAQDCDANFIITYSTSSPLRISCTPDFTEGVVSYEWDFGDGSAESMLSNPIHNYAETGVYTVCLLVTMEDGTTCESCVEICVSEPTESTVSITDFHLLEEYIDIYPNPNATFWNVKFSIEVAHDLQIDILDALGRSVYRKEYKATSGMNHITIPNEYLADGVYMIHIGNEKGNVSKKAMKQ